MLNVGLFWRFLAIVSWVFGEFSGQFCVGFCKKKKKKNVREIAFYFLAFPKNGLWVFL